MEHYLNLSIDDIEGEVWKDIKGYEGLYQVSNMGRVRSFARKKDNKPIIRKQTVKADGYLSVNFQVNSTSKNFRVNRLVAEAFIPNPENKEHVNHIDENIKNNMVSNLNWMTVKENINYGNHNVKAGIKHRKKVRCITTKKEFDSLKEAGDFYNCDLQSHMCKIVSGKVKSCGKLPDGTPLEWEYINE